MQSPADSLLVAGHTHTSPTHQLCVCRVLCLKGFLLIPKINVKDLVINCASHGGILKAVLGRASR